MKQIFLIGLAVLSILLLSCNKEEDGDKGTFTFDEKPYYLNNALNLDYGTIKSGVCKYQLELISSGLKYSSSIGDLIGQGNRISLTLISNEPTFPAIGTYTLNPTAEYIVGTIDEGTLFLNYGGATGSYDYKYTVSSGSITLEKSGSSYTINMNMTFLGGKTIIGKYTGNLTYSNWTKR